MKITILTIGKIKEKYYTDAINEYLKRMKRYCKTEIIEFPDEKTPDGASEHEEELIRDKEAIKILKYLDENKGYIITLEIKGQMIDSIELSEKIKKINLNGNSHIIFIIGGSLGLSKKVSDCSDYKLSFSKMTFPHQLMRVVLVEQIYRSFRILNHEPYHK